MEGVLPSRYRPVAIDDLTDELNVAAFARRKPVRLERPWVSDKSFNVIRESLRAHEVPALRASTRDPVGHGATPPECRAQDERIWAAGRASIIPHGADQTGPEALLRYEICCAVGRGILQEEVVAALARPISIRAVSLRHLVLRIELHEADALRKAGSRRWRE